MNRTTIAAGILLVALAGCSDPVEIDPRVSVEAEVEPGGEAASVTIRNDGTDSLLILNATPRCGLPLEFREEGEWQSLALACTAILRHPVEVEPGGERVYEESLVSPAGYVTHSGEPFLVGDPPRLPPGEYRFRFPLVSATPPVERVRRVSEQATRINPGDHEPAPPAAVSPFPRSVPGWTILGQS